MKNIWKIDEIEILRKIWNVSTQEELIKLIPNHSINSINGYATKKLSLKKDKNHTKILKSKNMSGNNNPRYGKPGINLGKIISIETKEKLRKAKLGKPGRKGKENPMYGKISWNNGKRTPKEIIQKGLKTKKQNYDNLSDEQKEIKRKRRSEQMIERIQNMNKSITIPEKITKDLLEELNISYETQKKIGFYLCDFYLPKYNLIIEVQGDYWHCNPKFYNENNINNTQKKNLYRDKTKYTYLTNKDFKIIYLWEYELKNDISLCKDRILKLIS